MELYCENTIQLINTGRQDCRDMHQWGPGMRNCYVIHYVIRGEGFLEINGKTYFIKAGESFLIRPFTTVFYYPNPQNPWEYTWIDFIGLQVSDFLGQLNVTPHCPVWSVQNSSRLQLLYDRLQELSVLHHNKAEANGILLAILGFYADSMPINTPTVQRENMRLSMALTLIRTNYHHSYFHVDTICQMMNLSRATLYRLFRAELGQSPISYLQNYRLEQAKKMLSMDSTVKVTSVSCGFDDPLYFSRLFKKYTGIAPSKYKALFLEHLF